MDNQQGKICELDIAWLAGFLDGEGSICMMKTNANRFRLNGQPVSGWVPRITIANTHKPTLERLVFIVEGLNLPHNICWRYPKNSRWKESWHLSAQGMKRFIRWADVLERYTFTKREQFFTARCYCQSRLQHCVRDPLTPYEDFMLQKFLTHKIPQRLNALKV